MNIETTAAKVRNAALSIAFVSFLLVIAFIIFPTCFKDNLDYDIFKFTYQFLLLTVIGGVITFLFTFYIKLREERARQKEQVAAKRKEEKSLQRKFYNEFIQAYNDGKKIRRFLRARTRKLSINNQNQKTILLKTGRYDELMQELTILQLRFELFVDEVRSNPALFSEGDVKSLKDNLEAIEKYLSQIVGEYEKCYESYPNQSYIDEVPFIPLSNFKQLEEFISKDETATSFKLQFKDAAAEVSKILLVILTSPKSISIANQWLDISEYPFTSYYFDINGHKLHYLDEGQGDTIVFVHGTPSWSFDFRNIIKRLRTDFRCVAVDHIGFGLSDKPEQYDYSTQNHSHTLETFVLDKKLANITLVVHDFGGPIGLNFAIRYPEKVKNLIILNSWLWSSKRDPDFIKLRKILSNPLLPLLYRYLNFSPRFILPKSFGERKLSKLILKQYTKPFADKTQRNGALAFATSLLNDQDWFEELWNGKQTISAKPTLFIWGMKDPVIKPHNLAKFVSGFTNSKIIKLETSGHYPQEEQPEIVNEAILEFLKRKHTLS